MKLDLGRDSLLTEFGRQTLKDRYLVPGENYQKMFARVAGAFADNEAHAQRMYDYMSKLWFMGATPVLSNGGTGRGLPISCYLNSVDDSMADIAAKWDEDVWLGAGGGGIGSCFSRVRSIGEPVRGRGGSSGVIPFIRVMDSLTLAVSQGSLRRGAGAAYLHISHPEIEEFLEIRKPTGDFNRKALNLHHGIVIPDTFMYAVRDDRDWDLVDPHSNNVRSTVRARELFQRVLDLRVQTGEPYLIFEGNVHRALPEVYRTLGLTVSQSNLCSEILLHTGPDHIGYDRTAVCCLGSVNLEKFDEWQGNEQFVEDCLRFLDNILQDFINQTEGKRGFERARYAAMRERSVGLGAMGFHSYLQSKMIPMESAMAKSVNLRMWRFIRHAADKANTKLAVEKGACPDSYDAYVKSGVPLVRFSHMLAVAPTASISIIAGGCSPCIEPWNANVFTQKTLSGSFEVRNRHLETVLENLSMNTPATWTSIFEHKGSVQHLNLPDDVKDVFKTAFEIDHRWIVDLAADRTPFIDQGQSLNLFLDAGVDKWDLLMLHYKAWEKGIKTMYYLRSRSIQRAAIVGSVSDDNKMERTKAPATIRNDYEECLACQ